MKTLFAIVFIPLLFSCYSKEVKPAHFTKTFWCLDAEKKDTVKYYGFTDLDTAIYYAKKERKDILVVFSCISCYAVPKMEWGTIALYKNKNLIHEKFVLVWLPVDSRKTAKDTSQVVFWYGKRRKLITEGDRHKYMEEHLFKQSTQPMFGFLDTLKRPFGKVIGYHHTKDNGDVEAFVKSGLRE